MTHFFQLDTYARTEDIERIQARLTEATGERCVVIPNGLRLVSDPMFYLCDRKACAHCHPECRHTTDIKHAINFEVVPSGHYWEVGAHDGTV